MKFLNDMFLKSDRYKEILDFSLKNSFPIGVTGVSEIHKAHIIYSLCSNKKCHALVIAADENEAQRLSNDITSMGLSTAVYPYRDFNFRNIDSISKEYEHNRLSALLKIVNDECDVVISCIDAALEYTINPALLKEKSITLRCGQRIEIKRLISLLVSLGYEKYDQVDGVGQFALRGGIIDLFPPDFEQPIRVEFFGDEIDTMSSFDTYTQRRSEPIDKIDLSPSSEIFIDNKELLISKIEDLLKSCNEKSKSILQSEIEKLQNNIIPASIDKFIPFLDNNKSTLFDYFSDDDFIFISENSKIKDRLHSNFVRYSEDLKDYLEDGVLCPGLTKYSEDLSYLTSRLCNSNLIYLDTFMHKTYPTELNKQVNISCKPLSVWNGSVSLLCDDLNSKDIANTYIVILAGTERSAKSLAEDLREKGFSVSFKESAETLTKGIITIIPGALSSGMEYGDIPFCLITHGIVLASAKKRKKNKHSKEIYSLAELSEGDYIVHISHGIGMFEGIHKMNIHGVVKDYIKLRYAKGDILYVPVTQLDMISKYIGSKESSQVKLHKLGGTEWQKTKSRVRTAVKSIAKELIKLYSERMNSKGFAFSEDNEWQRDFENHFEYDETPDQLNCISEIKADMQRPVPMERLLCGDVGFGKTEVALRAAFKCVTDSKQCAVLVPTTILAMQHYQTILRRFEGFPIKIELLSRFRTAKQQTEILKKLERGEIDLIVGTHRLVSQDIKFRDLGLVIIDEEQRFGVSQKERFKEMCKNVDVLTLSATPIPRTLNMAMSGIRDMSTLEEAPQNRYPVQTYVLEYDSMLINEAINKELRRGGQVYFLHNKVESIERVAASLQLENPNANVGFAHGKMSESELSEVWRKMMEQEINVLVCTTIIETGIDLPNVNTLIINNADHMGLSQLHQLRGRVGRSNRRAYAYLTFKRNKVLTEISQKRLEAIKEFTEFGSGFKIAMRDMELRGAGNILGAEQHGHMEDVGYDMYLKLLEQAVNEEKGLKTSNYELECLIDLNVQAHIPESYISNLSQRLDIYRRISDIRTKEDSLDVIDEIIDRFGDMPSAVKGLVDIALIRNTAASLGIYEIKQSQNTINLYQKNIDMKQVALIIRESKHKIMVNAGAKPYISIKLEPNVGSIDAIKEVLSIPFEQK